MNHVKKNLGIVITGCAMLFIGCCFSACETGPGTDLGSTGTPVVREVTTPAQGYAADFQWTTSDGTVHALSDYRGKVVVLNFWATWCGPCLSEIPSLQKIRTDSLDNNVEVIGASVDDRTPDGTTVRDYVQKFVQDNNMLYPVVLASDQMLIEYNVSTGIPYTIIVAPSGKISETLLGAKSENVFRDAIGKARNK